MRNTAVVALALLAVACTAKPVKQMTERLESAKTARAQPSQRPMIPRPASAMPQRTQTNQKPRIDELYEGSASAVNSRTASEDPRRPAGDITLDFKQTDIREVVRIILGDLLKVNFVIDSNVTGKVTLTTDRPLRKDDLIQTLEVILATQNAQIANYNGVFRISRLTPGVPIAISGIGVAKDTKAGGAEYRVYPLSFIAATEMEKILGPLLPKGAIIYRDIKRNILIVAGDSNRHRLTSDTIKIFDVNQMTTKNVLLISLQNANAKAVATELESILGVSQASTQAIELVQFIAIDRLNAIVIISKQQKYIEQARNWIYRLDRSWDPTERRLFVYYVQHGRANNLAKTLRGIIDAAGEAGGFTPVTASTVPLAPAPITGGLKPPNTALNQASQGSGAPQRNTQGTILGKELRISVDEDRNALLISATPKDFALIEDVLAKLDIQPLQVMIEASIFEVGLTDTLRYGIQYAISNGGLGITGDGNVGLTRGTSTLSSANNIISPLISPLLPGFSFTLEGSSKSRFIIDALSGLTDVTMISSPNVIVLNNKVARLRVGDEVPIVTQTTTSTLTENPLVVNSVQYRSTGVNLEVTPRVNASGMITLDITQEVSDVTTTTSSSIDSPTIKNRSLLSTVSVKSGDTILLGGLIREDSTDTESGIPVLSSLPVIGALFGQTTKTANRTELVVLIRPVLIATPKDAQSVTVDLRRKFISLLQREAKSIRQPRRIIKEN